MVRGTQNVVKFGKKWAKSSADIVHFEELIFPIFLLVDSNLNSYLFEGIASNLSELSRSEVELK